MPKSSDPSRCQLPSAHGDRYACGNLLPCPNPAHRPTATPAPITTPSDEAVRAACRDRDIHPNHPIHRFGETSEIARVLQAAYAVDIPRIVAEAHAAGAREAREEIVAWLREAFPIRERDDMPHDPGMLGRAAEMARAADAIAARFSEQETT
jgi:hypothetical protein